MKPYILLYCLFLSTSVFAQTSRGLSMWEETAAKAEGKTYALILGISNYKNPGIPKLQFADKDAIAFKDYLVETGVDSNNIILLTNENARYADIMFNLDELCSQRAQPGDKVFFYFSGHGDVESHVITNDGYLLPYDAPKAVYAISAINIKILQTYIATLSAKGVQAIVITDACHSGNLAGGLEGLKNIQTVLKENWKDEIKILSCQPGELSLEGKQWGNGRGLFSYELINGLAGLADKNKDGKITLRELNLYLLDKVPDGANPLPQNPVVLGNSEAVLASVSKAMLSRLSSANSNPSFAAIETRGFDEALLKNMNDSIRQNYNLFKSCLDKGYLVPMPSEKNLNTAYEFYQRIKETDSTRLLVALMKRNLCTKLSTELCNRMGYLIENKMSKMGGGLHLDAVASTLRTLLGDDKLTSLGVLPKVLSAQAWKNAQGSAEQREWTRNKIDTAIGLDSSAAYLYFIRALTQKESAKKMKDLDYSILLSPRFYYSYFMVADQHLDNGHADSALATINLMCALNLIINTDSELVFSMADLKTRTYYALNQKDSVAYYLAILDSFTQNSPNPFTGAYRNNTTSQVHFALKDYEAAIFYASFFTRPPFNHNPPSILLLAKAYARLNNAKQALYYLDSAMASERFDFKDITEDEDLASLRTTPEFKAQLKKYYPTEYKK